MRNKKIWSLLIVMTMLVALVVPAQASGDTVYLLTNNAVAEGNAEAFATQTGVAAYETTDGNVVITENNGAAVSIEGKNPGTLFDGDWCRNGTWTKWGANFDATVDIGGTADITKVIVWDVPMRGAINVSMNTFLAAGSSTTDFSDNTYIQEKGTITIQTSADGLTWNDAVTAQKATYTADNACYEMDGQIVVNVMFKQEYAVNAADARYVRVFVQKGAYQARIAEIAIFGTNFELPPDPADGLTLLTQNPLSVASIAKLAALTGNAVYTYPTEGYIPVVSASTNGFCERAQDVPTMFDGAITDNAWSAWGGAGQSFDMVIDLGGTQKIEHVVYWNNADGRDNAIGTPVTDTLWEDWKDTFDFASMAVSTSDDGSAWTERVAAFAPTTATADSTFYAGPEAGIDRVFHAHVATLAEPVSARYVKLTVAEKAGDYQFRSGEVAVLGKATAKKLYDVVSGQTALSAEVLEYMGDAIDGEVQMTGLYNPVKMVVTDPHGYAAATDSANLQNGNVTDRNVCISGWGDNTGYIDIDLGNVQEVSNVFLWNVASDTGSPNGITGTEADHTARKGESFRAVKVWTSEDGETYTEGEKITIGDRTVDEVWFDSTLQRICHAYQYDLATPVNARYVRVEIDFGYHLNMGEAIVVGKRINNFTKNVLSGQSITDSAGYTNLAAHYNKLGINLTKENTTATMLYDENDIDSVGRDSSLSDGFITVWTGPTGGTECTSTKWGLNPVNMYVTFDQAVIVDGVDVWCTDEGNTRWTASIDIYKSADGVEWELVGSQANLHSKDTGAQEQEYISFACEPFKTKYLRVDANNGKYQNVISEIVVFGTVPPTATAPVFVDAAGDEWSGMTPGIVAKTTFSGGAGTLVVGWYDKDMKELKKVYTATGSGEVSVDMSADEEAFYAAGSDIMRAFAFDSLSEIQLLAPSVTELSLGE